MSHTTVWILVGVLALGTLVAKAFGPVLAGGRTPPRAVQRVITMLTPALITSLVVTGTLITDQHLSIDARVAGVGAGLVALVLKAPLIAALVIAAATTATLRAVT